MRGEENGKKKQAKDEGERYCKLRPVLKQRQKTSFNMKVPRLV